jgi:uncharacterized protein YecT (DUF1311 family)
MRFMMILALAFPVTGYAAGFDCGKAVSDVEKSICADATLSRLDGDLTAAWKQALAVGGDTDALKASQLDWLKQRDTCGRDTQCLANRYQERLRALGDNARGVNSRWQQSWSRDIQSTTSGGKLIFTGTSPKLHFTISANAGANDGGLDGDILLRGDHATYHRDECQLDFTRHGPRIEVKQKGDDADCGAGMGVYYSGDYIPTAQFKTRPKPDLLSLKVLDDAKQNAAAHALLGKDYNALRDTINLGTQANDQDQVGAKVDEYFVRGLASTNAAVVMRKGEWLWIGLLVFDSRDLVRMRYYTNVSTWKTRVPKTILAWHHNIDESMPIDMMP